MAKEVDLVAAVSRAKTILAMLKTTSLTVLGPAVAACVLWAVCEAWGVPEMVTSARESCELYNTHQRLRQGPAMDGRWIRYDVRTSSWWQWNSEEKKQEPFDPFPRGAP